MLQSQASRLNELTRHQAAVRTSPMTRKIPREFAYGWRGVSRTTYNDLGYAIGTFRPVYSTVSTPNRTLLQYRDF
jgi:hypothetical protein